MTVNEVLELRPSLVLHNKEKVNCPPGCRERGDNTKLETSRWLKFSPLAVATVCKDLPVEYRGVTVFSIKLLYGRIHVAVAKSTDDVSLFHRHWPFKINLSPTENESALKLVEMKARGVVLR